jgi:hypothetical protein
MRNVQITSNDAEIDQRLAELQPYVESGLTVSVSQPGQRTSDGGTEHSEPVVEDYSQVVPGEELREDVSIYDRRVEEFKKQWPDFDAVVGQDLPIFRSVLNTILKMPNGPQIAYFLGSSPNLVAALCNLHPLDAARHVQEMSDDLARGSLPIDNDNFQAWKWARERKGK